MQSNKSMVQKEFKARVKVCFLTHLERMKYAFLCDNSEEDSIARVRSTLLEGER